MSDTATRDRGARETVHAVWVLLDGARFTLITTPKISNLGFTPASRNCVSTRFIIEMPSSA
jgi:hypothetical protein